MSKRKTKDGRSRLRLLWLSDSPACTTGLGRATSQILARLHATGRYDILARGWGHNAASQPQALSYRVEPAQAGPEDARSMAAAIKQFKPDVVVTFGDPWHFAWLSDTPGFDASRWVGYFPIDAGPLAAEWKSVVASAAWVAAPSEFSLGVLRLAVPNAKTRLIPHGVDLSVFHPLEDRRPGAVQRCHSSEFVVGFVGRNQPRKQIPTLVRAFASFSRGRSDAFLYLHTAPVDLGWDVPALIAHNNLQGQATACERVSGGVGVSDVELNEIYNSLDVLVQPSSGEGFGLPTLEAMAAGTPVVATDASANRELVGGRGELIRVRSWGSRDGTRIPSPDEGHLVEILERLYSSGALRQRCSSAGLEFAQGMGWGPAASRWDELIQEAAGLQPAAA